MIFRNLDNSVDFSVMWTYDLLLNYEGKRVHQANHLQAINIHSLSLKRNPGEIETENFPSHRQSLLECLAETVSTICTADVTTSRSTSRWGIKGQKSHMLIEKPRKCCLSINNAPLSLAICPTMCAIRHKRMWKGPDSWEQLMRILLQKIWWLSTIEWPQRIKVLINITKRLLMQARNQTLEVLCTLKNCSLLLMIPYACSLYSDVQ